MKYFLKFIFNLIDIGKYIFVRYVDCFVFIWFMNDLEWEILKLIDFLMEIEFI